MATVPAYFEPVFEAGWEKGELAERFRATDLTLGSWWPGAQHGGPPIGLLTRAISRHDHGENRQLARITVDILAPVPVGEIKVVSHLQKPGRHIELVGAEIRVAESLEERTVARATGWRFSSADSSKVQSRAPNPYPSIDQIPSDPESRMFPDSYNVGFTGTVDWRIIEPRESPNPTAAWIRIPYPLVAGETTTPLEQVGTLADIANGMSARVDPKDWSFMNTDLTLNLLAPPTEEWLAMTSSSSIGPDGRGLCLGTIYDSAGLLGHITQTQFVRPRSSLTARSPGSRTAA